MSKPLQVGSDSWRTHVFSTPPIEPRNAKARPSVRSLPQFDGETIVAEGINELCTVYILHHLKRVGTLLRWKRRPFEWSPGSSGAPRVPKFLVELAQDRKLLVIQTRSERFMTAKAKASFKEEEMAAEKAGMLHRVWTEARPLTNEVRSLQARIRGARNTVAEPAALQSLVDFVGAQRRATITEIVGAGHDPSLIAVGIRAAQLYVALDKKLEACSVVTTAPQSDARAFLLLAGVERGSWWKSLRDK